MLSKLTKPQRLLMTNAMRHGDASVYGATYRIATNLSEKGYGELSYSIFTPTREGLEALLYDRKVEDCLWGSMATMTRVKEVEEALKGGDFSNGC